MEEIFFRHFFQWSWGCYSARHLNPTSPTETWADLLLLRNRKFGNSDFPDYRFLLSTTTGNPNIFQDSVKNFLNYKMPETRFAALLKYKQSVCESGIHKSKFPKKSPDFICGIRSGNGLAKAESIFHKIFDRSTKNVGGNNLWSRSTKFENIVEFVTFTLWNSTIFLGPTYFLWNRICEFRFMNAPISVNYFF